MFGEPLYKYFGVGARLIYLRHAVQRLPIHGEGYVLNVLDLFLKDIEKFPFATTRVAAGGLRMFYSKVKDYPNDYVLSDNQAKELSKLADNLTPIFEAESKHIQTVVLVEKRFDMGKLMGKVSALMGKGTYEDLPDIAKFDMDESGKCLALNRATAAAFHALRATEAKLKELYFSRVKKGRLKRPMWNDMVTALRNRKAAKLDENLLDHLDMIRKNYRNPTQHPDMTYDIDEAQDLFANCIAAMNMMTRQMKQRRTRLVSAIDLKEICDV